MRSKQSHASEHLWPRHCGKTDNVYGSELTAGEKARAELPFQSSARRFSLTKRLHPALSR